MKIAILSDVHGNLEALLAVKKDLLKEKVDRIVFLGDIVGYGANPNECIEELTELTSYIVAGNHDWAAVGKTDISYFNPVAKEAIIWTSKMLNTYNYNFLSNLPLKGSMHDFLYVHASPFRPENWYYIFSTQDARFQFEHFSEDICFVGHSHVPVIILKEEDSIKSFYPTDIFYLSKGCKCIINVGSVGQPRDTNPYSAYGIYDTEKRSFLLKRVSYDIKTAQDKILKAGLPPSLARRLEIGW